MKQVLILPTWVLMKLTLPLLPKSHLFKGKEITLKDWAENGTQLNYGFSMLFGFKVLL